MQFKEITADGDYDLPPVHGTVTERDRLMVKVFLNPGSATIIFGCKGNDGNFSAFADGTITGEAVLNVGFGTQLMVQVSGHSGGTLVIGYSV